MAISKDSQVSEVDQLMLDSGTTSHMTPYVEQLHNKKPCNVNISLGDDSTVKATSTGTRVVHWAAHDVVTKVSLSETLASEKLAMSLLSGPALAAKGLYVLFTSEEALIIDSLDNFRVIGNAPKQKDGLYYVASHQLPEDAHPINMDDAKVRAMMAVVKNAGSTAHSDESIDDSDDNMSEAFSSCDGDENAPLMSDDESESDDEEEIDMDKMQMSAPVAEQNSSSSISESPLETISTQRRSVSMWHNRLAHVAS